MGMFQGYISIGFEMLMSLINELVNQNDPQKQEMSLIVKLRAIWLLEKVARNPRLFREDRQQKIAQIFEPLADYFSKNDQFVIQF